MAAKRTGYIPFTCVRCRVVTVPMQTRLNSTRVDGTVAAPPSIPDVSSVVQDTSDASAIQRPSGDDNAATNDNEVSYLIITFKEWFSFYDTQTYSVIKLL